MYAFTNEILQAYGEITVRLILGVNRWDDMYQRLFVLTYRDDGINSIFSLVSFLKKKTYKIRSRCVCVCVCVCVSVCVCVCVKF